MQPLPNIYPIVGGLLIGLSAAVLLLLNGRIAGVSGLLASALRFGGSPPAQAAAFVLAIPLGAWLAAKAVRQPEIVFDASIPLLVAGGLLVGFGTRLGSGCTSGHGVCGLARLSPRSMIATALFMASGIATVFLLRHLIGA